MTQQRKRLERAALAALVLFIAFCLGVVVGWLTWDVHRTVARSRPTTSRRRPSCTSGWASTRSRTCATP
jgi:hypothetical protein